MRDRICTETDQLCIYDLLTGKHVRVTSPPRKLCEAGHAESVCVLKMVDLPGIFYSDSECQIKEGKQTVILARSCE